MNNNKLIKLGLYIILLAPLTVVSAKTINAESLLISTLLEVEHKDIVEQPEVGSSLTFPQVDLSDTESLKLYAEIGTKVYNIKSVENKIGVGIYEWDGADWNKFYIQDFSEFNTRNNQIEVKGEYSNNNQTDASNYLNVTVEVKNAGIFAISAVSDISNGYYFTTTGEFFVPGVYTISVPALGQPINGQVDSFTLFFNGVADNTKASTFTINVEGSSK